MSIKSLRIVNTFTILKAALMIAGTAIGAGMLGIPLVTGEIGLAAGALATILVWLYMYITGLLLVEVSISMKEKGGFLEMAGKYLPPFAKGLVGILFLFLYGILMVAYISAGAEIFCLNLFDSFMVRALFPMTLLLFLSFGSRRVISIISLLTIPLWVYFCVFYFLGAEYIKPEQLLTGSVSKAYLAVPVLFGAFGYHNVIPSITTYLNYDKKALKKAIWLGSFAPCIVYFLWQVLILGMVDSDTLMLAKEKGVPVVSIIGSITNNVFFQSAGAIFAFFALITSALGVSISVVRFVDKQEKKLTSFFVILIPAIIAFINPGIFLRALSFAGGFGESILNGIIPIWLFVAYKKMQGNMDRRLVLPITILLIAALAVVAIELGSLI